MIYWTPKAVFGLPKVIQHPPRPCLCTSNHRSVVVAIRRRGLLLQAKTPLLLILRVASRAPRHHLFYEEAQPQKPHAITRVDELGVDTWTLVECGRALHSDSSAVCPAHRPTSWMMPCSFCRHTYFKHTPQHSRSGGCTSTRRVRPHPQERAGSRR